LERQIHEGQHSARRVPCDVRGGSSLLLRTTMKPALPHKLQHLVATACLALVVACVQTQRADVAIRGVTVVDVTDGSVSPDRTVLIQGNRIVVVGSAAKVAVPDNADVVEAQGRYLIPGLWDMHVHSVANVALDQSDQSVAAQDWHFPLFLAHGVTGVRNMNDGAGDMTLELTKSVRRRLAEGDLRGPPRFLSAGPSIDGDPPLGSNPIVVRTAAEARVAVEQLVANGADLIKVYENLSRDAYFAIVDEARRRGIPVDGHVPFRITPEEAAAAGQRTVEHPDALAAGCSTAAEAERKRFANVLANHEGLPDNEKFLAMFRHVRALYDSRDSAACASAIEAYRRNGVAVTVDLLAYHHVVHAKQMLSDTTGMGLVPQAIRRKWEDWAGSEMTREFQSILQPIVPLELENVRVLNEAGVVLLAATDVGVPLQVPGLGLHRELVRLVEAGLTPLQALQTATINPARVLGLADSLGTVEPGKLADLVLLDANALEDISNTQRIRAVVADGRLYRRADLDRLLSTSRP
jgi:imidazolonepropionase-like amidohydrolase